MLVLMLPGISPNASTGTQAAQSKPESLSINQNYNTIGRYSLVFREPAAESLSLEQARQAFRNGLFRPANQAVPAFGLGHIAVWLKVDIRNPTSQVATRRLGLEAPWLDKIDVYLLHQGDAPVHLQAGDERPLAARQLQRRKAIFEHHFKPGISTLYLRVESDEPVVIPAHFSAPYLNEHMERLQDYGYGALYGMLGGLLLYNLLIFFIVRQQRYLYYVLYLATYLLMDISYTGHGYFYLWPDVIGLQHWAPATSIFLYASAGILFALSFLEMRKLFPRIWRATLILVAAMMALQIVLILLQARALSVIIALSYITGFFLLTFYYGVISYRKGLKAAIYYLYATFATLLGGSITVLCVAAVIPFNWLTFHIAEVAVSLDAILLSIALAEQIRRAQSEKQQALSLARTDILTRLHNRLAFNEVSEQIWQNADNNQQPLCFIMLDIDHFKEINDRYGHSNGDLVLQTVSATLKKIVRENDLLVRWGGEEFAVILPDTTIEQAIRLAERIRCSIEQLQIKTGDNETITTTVSLGVAQKTRQTGSMEAIFNEADNRLYHAKQAGRNRVCSSIQQSDYPQPDCLHYIGEQGQTVK